MSKLRVNNFEELLDGGRGSRHCDTWLAENISGKKIKYTDNYRVSGNKKDYCSIHKEVKLDNTTMRTYNPVRKYTTGDSIDPIWTLAKDYFEEADLRLLRNHHASEGFVCKVLESSVDVVRSTAQETEQLAIAEALFKAYQKENIQPPKG